MTATYEQIEDEAHRRFDENPCTPLAHYIIEVTRENWTPPPPVDPDLLAYREWQKERNPSAKTIDKGAWDKCDAGQAFLAGAQMARAQEQERAKVLVEYIGGLGYSDYREELLAAYKAGKAAR